MTAQQLKKNACNNFKYARNQLKLTQLEFAEKLGINRALLASIEEHRAISIINIYRLSRFINVSMDTITTTDMSKKKPGTFGTWLSEHNLKIMNRKGDSETIY